MVLSSLYPGAVHIQSFWVGVQLMHLVLHCMLTFWALKRTSVFGSYKLAFLRSKFIFYERLF